MYINLTKETLKRIAAHSNKITDMTLKVKYIADDVRYSDVASALEGSKIRAIYLCKSDSMLHSNVTLEVFSRLYCSTRLKGKVFVGYTDQLDSREVERLLQEIIKRKEEFSRYSSKKRSRETEDSSLDDSSHTPVALFKLSLGQKIHEKLSEMDMDIEYAEAKEQDFQIEKVKAYDEKIAVSKPEQQELHRASKRMKKEETVFLSSSPCALLHKQSAVASAASAAAAMPAPVSLSSYRS